jgi:hypothetical protein
MTKASNGTRGTPAYHLQFEDLLDRPIAFHRCFAALAGSALAGLMLSQAVYWSKRTRDNDGWFWKTQQEWHDETFMTRSEQETARKKLRDNGLIEEELRGLPARTHYRVCLDVIKQALLNQQHEAEELPF